MADMDLAFHLSSASGLRIGSEDSEWTVTSIVGHGAANHVARVAQRHLVDIRNDSCHTSDSVGYAEVLRRNDTVVVKHAPPYLAKAPDMAFSTYRQTIEARALKLLHTSVNDNPLGLSAVLLRNPSIAIPEVLLHDGREDVHVLVQSDLGTHPDLFEVITSQLASEALAASLGSILGDFFADLLNCMPADCNPMRNFFRNIYQDDMMLTVINHVTDFMYDARVPDYEDLGNRALEHWRRRMELRETWAPPRHSSGAAAPAPTFAFGQGDIWFGGLLIALASRGGEVSARIGVVDWEFAGPNHPAADLAQLGCYLHLLSLSPRNTDHRRQNVLALCKSLYRTFWHQSPMALRTGEDSMARKQGDGRLPSGSEVHLKVRDSEMLHSLLVMHGWEMVNAASWNVRQHLWCDCPGEGPTRCQHIIDMIHVGASMIRAAGDTPWTVDRDFRIDYAALNDIEWCRRFLLPYFVNPETA